MESIQNKKKMFFSSRTTDILRCSIDGCTVSNQGDNSCFYRIPKINERGELTELSEQKLSAWISALGMSNDEHTTHQNVYVCQTHYVAGMNGINVFNWERFYQNVFFIEISGKLRDTSKMDTICLDSDSAESGTSFEFDHCNDLSKSSLDKNLNKKQLLSQNQVWSVLFSHLYLLSSRV